MTLAEFIAFIEANPDTYSWSDLSGHAADRGQYLDLHNPARREQLYNRVWLHATQAQIDTGNSRLPEGVRIEAVPLDIGGLGVSCDLLTECRAGMRYEAIRTALRNAKLVVAKPVHPVDPPSDDE